MAEFRPTPAQKLAIEAPVSDLLVSAAAGSGKTAVLSRRILHLLSDPDHDYDIGRMLVVTFTKDSATELKNRIGKVLRTEVEELTDREGRSEEEERRLARFSAQLAKVESAEISTIHSFCYSLVRKNFALLGIPASLRVGDESETALLRFRVMEETIDGLYEKDEAFPAFADHMIALKDDRLSEILIDFYTKLIGTPGGLSSLKQCLDSLIAAAEDFSKSNFFSSLMVYADWFFDYYRETLKAAMEELENDPAGMKNYYPSVAAAYDMTRRWQEGDDRDYSMLAGMLASYVSVPLGRGYRGDKTPEASRAQTLRTQFEKELKALRDSFFSFTPDAIRKDCLATADTLQTLYRALTTFDENYSAAKLRYGLLDYNDLERYTYSLLVDEEGKPTPLALSVQQRYDALFIDEYQDTNGLQDAIFSVVSRHDRFMVGDIKQSIYSFRGARPELFSAYRSRFPDYVEGSGQKEARLFLSENFRSDKSIIDFSNTVFSVLFNHNSGKVPYLPEDALKCSRAPADDAGLPVCFYMVDTAAPEDQSRPLTEADFVAEKIAALVRQGVCPEDIVILMRSTHSHGDAYREALARRSVACVSEDAGESLFDCPEILLLLSLLRVIDNPTRDIPLAAVLKSPLFGFSLSDLIALRQIYPDGSLYAALVAFAGEPEGCFSDAAMTSGKDGDVLNRTVPYSTVAGSDAAGSFETEASEWLFREEDRKRLKERVETFFRQLMRYRRYAEMRSADRVIRYLLSNTPLRAIAVKHTGSGDRLWDFYEFARRYEAASFHGVHGLLRHVDDMLASPKAQPPQKKQKVDLSAVRILTIHKSKGCEYDYVFLAETEHSFGRSRGEDILFDPQLGIGMRLREENGYVRYDTLLRRIIEARQKCAGLDEEMRILYVALTRARKQLIITASKSSHKEKKGDAKPAKKPKEPKTLQSVVDERLASARHPHPWLFLKGGSFAHWLTVAGGDIPIQIVDKSNFDAQVHPVGRVAPEGRAEGRMERVSEEILKERLSFTYPHGIASSLPTKLSVSRLYPGILDEEAEELLRSEKADFEQLPLFMQENLSPSGAERGTATHLFMQFCDFERVAQRGIEEEIARLCEEKFITSGIAGLIDRYRLRLFFQSSLFAAMRHARRLYREQRFNVRLPASDFTEDEAKASLLEGETVLVQGVVDCLMEEVDGSLTLVDYKTDRTPGDRREAEILLKERYTTQLTYYRRAVEKIFGRPVSRTLIYSFGLGDTVALD